MRHPHTTCDLLSLCRTWYRKRLIHLSINIFHLHFATSQGHHRIDEAERLELGEVGRREVPFGEQSLVEKGLAHGARQQRLAGRIPAMPVVQGDVAVGGVRKEPLLHDNDFVGRPLLCCERCEGTAVRAFESIVDGIAGNEFHTSDGTHLIGRATHFDDASFTINDARLVETVVLGEVREAVTERRDVRMGKEMAEGAVHARLMVGEVADFSFFYSDSFNKLAHKLSV